MVRIQVRLTQEQAEALRRLAERYGVSVSELIHESVQRLVADDEMAEKWRRASELIGRYDSGLSDVTENHDKYLDEAYLPWQ